jgi:hypothetical protein
MHVRMRPYAQGRARRVMSGRVVAFPGAEHR